MSAITTHVLDTARGCPGRGITVRLELFARGGFEEIAQGVTNADGRIPDLLPKDYELTPGVYRLTFDTQSYFQLQAEEGFYPYVPVIFSIENPLQHYHVPLLLSPFGYSTYRGS